MTIAKKIAKNNSTVDTATNTVISMTQYKDLLAWAEKVSNGQLDAATQIKTHCATWLNADVDKQSIIEIIKTDDLNGFRRFFLAPFNFAVKDDAGYIHKLYTYENGDCVLAEIPTTDPANEEIINCNEIKAATTDVTNAPEGDDDDELIDLPAITPADDFATKLAELKAKQDAAKTAELAAKKVYKEASDNYVECQEATQNFLDAHADNLTEKISALEIESRITMVRDNGKERYDLFDTSQLNVYAFNGFGKMFIVRCRGNELGTYDTPAQIEVVINQLKAAVERGDSEFTFPTIEELAKPEVDKTATADSLSRAMTIALEHYQDFCRFGNLTAATNELSLYNICRKAMTELLRREAA